MSETPDIEPGGRAGRYAADDAATPTNGSDPQDAARPRRLADDAAWGVAVAGDGDGAQGGDATDDANVIDEQQAASIAWVPPAAEDSAVVQAAPEVDALAQPAKKRGMGDAIGWTILGTIIPGVGLWRSGHRVAGWVSANPNFAAVRQQVQKALKETAKTNTPAVTATPTPGTTPTAGSAAAPTAAAAPKAPASPKSDNLDDACAYHPAKSTKE